MTVVKSLCQQNSKKEKHKSIYLAHRHSIAHCALKGWRLHIYVLLKILKLCVQPQPKLTSYDLKWAVNEALLNMIPTKEEIGACIRRVLNHATLRDRFDDSIHKELEALGIAKVEVLDERLRFVRKQRQQLCK